MCLVIVLALGIVDAVGPQLLRLMPACQHYLYQPPRPSQTQIRLTERGREAARSEVPAAIRSFLRMPPDWAHTSGRVIIKRHLRGWEHPPLPTSGKS
jgi:hypothetical protein